MAKNSAANTIGHVAGKVVSGVLMLEAVAFNALCKAGVPGNFVTCSKWLLRVVLLAALAFLSIGLLVSIALLIAVALVLKSLGSGSADLQAPNLQPVEWRDGDQGYGFYDAFGVRDHNVK